MSQDNTDGFRSNNASLDGMKVHYHNKLARDKIPEMLTAKGITCETEILDNNKYTHALHNKLQEEVTEFLCAENNASQLEEMADILEVMHAHLASQGLSFTDLEAVRQKKFSERGGFHTQLFLKRTITPQSSHNITANTSCLFCRFAQGREDIEIIARFRHCFAIADRYPVSPGHLLIIPYEHTENWFTASEEIRNDIIAALTQMKARWDQLYCPDGYNIGANCGVVAGQSIMHLHMHLIPRFTGDVDNPKGGVRGVIPAKQSY